MGWKHAIKKASSSVVSVEGCQVRAFEAEGASAMAATAVIVDKKRGFLLTNKHVACAPFMGYMRLENHEEVPIRIIYEDPVHDFAYFYYDPRNIKRMKPEALELRPDLARPGVEIKIVGNDAGEKLSIHSGFISRIDRNPPEYDGGYCDTNTPYIQASTGTVGGSSGSPAVNIEAHMLAIDSGQKYDATTNYLSILDRAQRALRCIQKGEPVTRGTIQCVWLMKSFEECRRLGMTPRQQEQALQKFPRETGMLVATTIIPKGPSDGKIKEGDILIRVGKEIVTQFVPLEEILDSNVNKTIRLVLQRGANIVNVLVSIGDLHKITPDRFFQASGAIFHNVSLQLAQRYAIPCRGVFVRRGNRCWPMGVRGGYILETVNQKEVTDIEGFIDIWKSIPYGSRAVATYRHVKDMQTLRSGILEIGPGWANPIGPQLAVRNNKTGLWDFTDVILRISPTIPTRRSGGFIRLQNIQHSAAADIVESIALVSCDFPLELDHAPDKHRWGAGIVIDAEKGLVLVSRVIKPHNLCDINVYIAGSIRVKAKSVWPHPTQGYSVIKYDPSLVGSVVKSANLSTEHVSLGDPVYFVGYNNEKRLVAAKTTITDIQAENISKSTTAAYQATNVEAIKVGPGLAEECNSGVVVGEDGTVQAIWLDYLYDGEDRETYSLGLATPAMVPIVEQLRRDKTPQLRTLGVQFTPLGMADASTWGVSDEWIQKITKDNPNQQQLFAVKKQSPARDTGALRQDDVVLQFDGTVCSRLSRLDVFSEEAIEAVIVRAGVEMNITLPTIMAAELATSHVISFCGATLQRPHNAVQQRIRELPSEVYVSATMDGSPAHQYRLKPTVFITHVNGTATPDMRTFFTASSSILDNTHFVLGITSSDGVPSVLSMITSQHYFPTIEWIEDPSNFEGWKTIVHNRRQTRQ